MVKSRFRGTRIGLRALALCGGLLSLMPAEARASGVGRPARAGSVAAPPTPRSAAELDLDVRLRNAMQRGFSAYRSNDLLAALAAFEEAWALKAHPAVAASLAEVGAKLNLHLAAAEHWKFCVDNLGVEQKQLRERARQQLLLSLERIGRLTIKPNVAQAALFLDNKKVALMAAPHTLLLEPGEHTLRAELRGHEPWFTTISVRPGEEREVRVHMVRTPPEGALGSGTSTAPVRSSDEALAQSAWSPAKLATVLIGAGLTTIAAGTWVAFSLEAAAAQDKTDELRAGLANFGPDTCARAQASDAARCSRLRSSSNWRDSATTTANVVLAVGGATALATIACWLFWPRQQGQHGARLLPTFGLGPAEPAGARGHEAKIVVYGGF